MATRKESLEQQMQEQEFLESQLAELEAAMGGESVEDTQVGLPPYWKPIPEIGKSAVGQMFIGIPMRIDMRDENFHRYVIQATRETQCFRGPNEEAESVIVKPGELFTTSVHAGLDLTEYYGMKVGVIIISDTPLKPLEDGTPRNFYRWKVRLLKAEAKELDDFRKEKAKMLREEARMASVFAMQQRRLELQEKRAKLLTVNNGSPAVSQTPAQ